jgi:hypothetical protein
MCDIVTPEDRQQTMHCLLPIIRRVDFRLDMLPENMQNYAKKHQLWENPKETRTNLTAVYDCTKQLFHSAQLQFMLGRGCEIRRLYHTYEFQHSPVLRPFIHVCSPLYVLHVEYAANGSQEGDCEEGERPDRRRVVQVVSVLFVFAA